MKHKPASRKTGLRRLLKLADYVANLPRERFNFSHFVSSDWKGTIDFSCGTTACALGWATTMPFFRNLGLHLSRYGQPTLGHFSFTRINKTIFALEQNEADNLFIFGAPTPENRSGIDTPKEWARYARRFVAHARRQLKCNHLT